jgi:ABC-type nitrate/sulfonate/bicarbonate transport system substrate-binding protein
LDHEGRRFFKQEGLDANLVYISSSSTMAQAMLAGDVALSTANSQAVVDTSLQGGDLVSAGAIVNFVALYVIAAPRSKCCRLEGKPVKSVALAPQRTLAFKCFSKIWS